MVAQTNTIDIPGYKSEVDYGSDFGQPSISQHIYDLAGGKEIAFYNHPEKDIGYRLQSLVAVWRIKERH